MPPGILGSQRREAGRAAVIDIGINHVVGPVTVAMLMRNAVTAHKWQIAAGWLG